MSPRPGGGAGAAGEAVYPAEVAATGRRVAGAPRRPLYPAADPELMPWGAGP